MSEFDEMDFDEDEIASMTDNNQDQITPEEIFKMVLVNKLKGTTVKVQLKDENEDNINLSDVIEQLTNFIKDKLQEDSNQFVEQIMPLMAQSVVSGLGRMIGIAETALYLSNPTIRMAIIDMMSISFLLLKFVQDNNLKIYTYEEKVSSEEIDKIERKSKVNSIATLSSLIGADPKEILQKMVKTGEITAEDIKEITGESYDNGSGKNEDKN